MLIEVPVYKLTDSILVRTRYPLQQRKLIIVLYEPEIATSVISVSPDCGNTHYTNIEIRSLRNSSCRKITAIWERKHT